MPRISITDLTALADAALRASGASSSQANAAARNLVAADAQGLATHGVARVPTYCAHLKSGRTRGDAVPRIVRDSGAACLVDAALGNRIRDQNFRSRHFGRMLESERAESNHLLPKSQQGSGAPL